MRWSILSRTLCNYNIFRLVIHSKLTVHRTLWNLGIFTNLVYSSLKIMRTRRIPKTLLDMYDRVFSSESYVTVAYSEPCQISITGNFIQRPSVPATPSCINYFLELLTYYYYRIQYSLSKLWPTPLAIHFFRHSLVYELQIS